MELKAIGVVTDNAHIPGRIILDGIERIQQFFNDVADVSG